METKMTVNVAGTEITVPVDEAISRGIVNEFIANLLDAYIADVGKCDDLPNLEDDEYDEVICSLENICSRSLVDVADSIVRGEIRQAIECKYHDIIDHRPKYYTVEATISVPVTFVVRADGEESAAKFLRNMDARDIVEDPEWGDSEIENWQITDEDDECPGAFDPYIVD